MTTNTPPQLSAKMPSAALIGSPSLVRTLKSLYYRIFKRYRRLELKLCTYAEADAILRKQGIPGNPDEGWRIAREEDSNRVIGIVYLERRERILMENEDSATSKP